MGLRSNGRCVSLQLQTPQLQCPSGFSLTQVSKDGPRSTGFSGVELTCRRERSEAPVLNCPPGFVLNGTECSSVVSMAPELICRSSFSLTTDGASCARAEIRPPSQVKERAVTRININHAVLQSCPEDYLLYRSRCIRETLESGVVECPPNTQLSMLDQLCYPSAPGT
jgi:hypothetical protein